MKERIKNFMENIDKVRVLVESKKIKTKYEKLEDAYDLLYLDNIATNNEIELLKEENTKLQKEKREYLNAYKHLKEERRQLRMLLMTDCTLKDVKKSMGVK